MTDGDTVPASDLRAGRARRPPRPRRERSATESLLAISLGLEAAVLFFLTLVVFGLRVLDPVLAFSGGALFLLLLVVAAGVQRFRWGVWFGAALQLALVATGILLPIMFALGAGFAGLWLWCLLRGRQLDRQRAAFLAQQNPTEGEPS